MGFFSNSDKRKRRENDDQKEDPKKVDLIALDAVDIDEDLHGGPLIQGSVDGEVRIFGKFSQHDIHELMEWSGIFSALREKGYENTVLELQYLSDQDQRIFVKENDQVLIHIRLKVSAFRFRLHPGAPQRKLLYIDWLMTKHPHCKNFRPERLFPGQELPGLGIFSQISDFITNMALGVNARGAFNIPEYFHDAVLFQREFRFYDPVREAFFRGLMRDLRRYGAREISRAFAEDRIINTRNQVIQWQPGEMITILDPDLEEMIWSPQYHTRVVRELKRVSFKMLPRDP